MAEKFLELNLLKKIIENISPINISYVESGVAPETEEFFILIKNSSKIKIFPSLTWRSKITNVLFVNSSETKETGIWESYDVDYDVLVEPLRELYQRKTLDLKRKEFLDMFLNDGDNP